MEELGKKIRVSHRINDDTLDINNLSQYSLFLSIEDKNLRVAVVDANEKKCMVLEDYRFSGIVTRQDTIHQLDTVLEGHLVLRAGYWGEVAIIARSGGFVYVPEPYFDDMQKEAYLRFHPKNIENMSLYSHYHSRNALYSVFQVEQEFVNWAKKSYPNKDIKVLHQADVFLASALNEVDATYESNIFIDIENRYMNMLIVQNGQILLYNRYYYQSPQDFVYFLLFAIDELQVNPDSVRTLLYGEISKDSGIFNLLQKYVRNVEFGHRPKQISFSYKFDDVLEHRYFDLYNAYECLLKA
ncbi:MAG: hypothetical protein OHK0045_05960 [Raineya sp.]